MKSYKNFLNENVYKPSMDSDEIFFIWDEYFDDREDIEHGVTTSSDDKYSNFSFNSPDKKHFKLFMNDVKKLAKSKKWTIDYDDDSLRIYESINERKTIQVKRKYREYAPTNVGANAPVRQKILGFISEKGSCCKSDLSEFIRSANEETGRKTNPQWIKKNMKYLVTFEQDGETHYKLSKLGQRVIKATTVNEGIKKGDYVVVNTDNHKDPLNDLGILADDVFKVKKVNKDTLLISGSEGDFEVPIDSMVKEEVNEACDKHEDYDEECPDCKKLNESSSEDLVMKTPDGGELTIQGYKRHFGENNNIAAKNIAKKWAEFVSKIEKDHKVEVSFGSIYVQPN